MKKARVLFLILCALLATASFSNADPITFGLAEVLSGDTPIGTTPWLTATFADTGTSQVRLTLNATNLTGGTQFISQIYFNVDPNVFLLGSIPQFTSIGAELTDYGLSFTGLKAGPDGLFNLEFDFATSNAPNSDRFVAGESVFIDISWTGVLASSFNLVNSSGYLSIAHVQGIPLGASTEGSSWIVASPSASPVPEPATMILLGCGLSGLMIFGRKKLLT